MTDGADRHQGRRSVDGRSARLPGTRQEVALIAATVLLTVLFTYGPGTYRMVLPAAVAVAVAAAVVVWLAGRRPASALALVAVVAVALPLVGATFEAFDLLVVLVVHRAAEGTRLPAWVLVPAGLGPLVVNDAWQRIAFGQSFLHPSVLYPPLLTALAVGLGLRSRQIRRQHAELEALRERDRQLAVSEERRRIARDLHDVAAHHLSALVVRNKLARRRGTPEALDEAAGFTAHTAAQALDSLRQVVRVLDTAGEPPLAPHITLADLDDIIYRMREAGLRIERGPWDPQPAGGEVDVAVVRIAQEALTNILRHRGPGACWLQLVSGDSHLELTIDDDGAPAGQRHPVGGGPGSGRGLFGMRERAEACGGQLTIGPSPRGGWRVSARLPVRG